MELHELDALLDAARLPEATVDICLRGDLVAEWEQAEKQLRDAHNGSARTLAGGSVEEAELAKRVRELEEEMRGSTISVKLRAMRRPDWAKLVADHPPRKGNDGDKQLQINQETFYDALIAASIVEPALDAERTQRFLDALSDAQFDKLAARAWILNRKDVDVPFSQIASRITETSGEK